MNVVLLLTKIDENDLHWNHHRMHFNLLPIEYIDCIHSSLFALLQHLPSMHGKSNFLLLPPKAFRYEPSDSAGRYRVSSNLTRVGIKVSEL